MIWRTYIYIKLLTTLGFYHYKTKSKIMINTFKLINLQDNDKLFYDGNSMGIFPLYYKDDEEIISYLSNIESGNVVNEDPDIESWIKTCIKEIPKGAKTNTKKILKRQLQSIILPIAGTCNLKCPYCFARANRGNFAFPNYTEHDVDFILKQIDKHSHDIPINLIFFGGEPMMKYDIIKYTINQIKTKYPHLKVGYSITTNGTLLNKERIQFMRENNFALLLSMDGYDNNFNYRKFINGKSSVNRVLKNIDLLKSMNMPFEIRATITSDNPYVFETHVFFEELESDYILAFAYSSENKLNEDLNTFDTRSLSNIRNAYEKLLFYYRDKLKGKKPIYNANIATMIKTFETRLHRDYICAAGFNYFTVMADGSIYSCAHLMNNPQYIIGNISDFNSLINKRINYIAKDIKTIRGCKDCWAKNICNGGCPSQKLSMNVKANEPLPVERCELEKIEAEFYIRIYHLFKTINPQ